MQRSDNVNWEGLLTDEGRWPRQFIFFSHLVILASMTFLHLGFVTIGGSIPYFCCLLPLVGPVVATALLLGSKSGRLQGALAGIFLILHTIILPRGIAEHLFVTLLGGIGLMFAGWIAGYLFAYVLRNTPSGNRRKIYLALVGLAASALETAFFVGGAILFPTPLSTMLSTSPLGSVIDLPHLSEISNTTLAQLTTSGGRLLVIHSVVGSLVAQVLLDGLIAYGCARVADALARVHQQPRNTQSVRLLFRLQLLSMTTLILLIGAASANVRLTQYCWIHANNEMTTDLTRITAFTTAEIEARGGIEQAAPTISAMVQAYDLATDGTVTVCTKDGIIATNNPTHKNASPDLLNSMQNSPEVSHMLMTFFEQELDGGAEQGFLRVAKTSDVTIALIRPDTTVFRDRFFAMLSIATTTVILLTLVYVYAARLLALILANPIDQTNESLAKITSGDLDEVVNARGSLEFSSLSDGINTTVAALKDYAEETARRMEEDLATAQHIQQSCLPHLLPNTLSSVPFEIYASMRAAKDVGGDFYDFFLVDDHTLGFLIADVSGKGIPAALFMMEAKNEIATRMQENSDLAAALDAANSTLCVGNDEAMFVTVWAATLDWKTGELTYVNAGHNPPLLRHDGLWDWMPDDGGPMLGIGDFFSYESHVIHLAYGDELLLYTDGVTEAMNPQNQLFSEKRFLAFLREHPMLSPHALDDAIKSEVAGWANGAEQSDDITLLSLEIICDL